jgi:hypothetical protein
MNTEQCMLAAKCRKAAFQVKNLFGSDVSLVKNCGSNGFVSNILWVKGPDTVAGRQMVDTVTRFIRFAAVLNRLHVTM